MTDEDVAEPTTDQTVARRAADLAIVGRTDFTRDQVELMRRTLCAGATNDELSMFLAQCRRTGLDPFAKQIYLVKRWDSKRQTEVMAIQVGIDGYRLIADRTGLYAGNDDPVFDDEANPQRATVTVYKFMGGQRCAITASARWSQYYPGDKAGFMWKKMPHLMLGKCAEALALRKAFPAELSGLYIAEELAEAGQDPEVRTITPEQIAEINDLIAECEAVGNPVHLGRFLGWLNVPSLDELPAGEFTKAVHELNRKRREKKNGGAK